MGSYGNSLLGAFGIIITNPCEIFCSFKYVKIIDYDVVLNAQKSTQVSSGNVAKMVPIYDLSRRARWIQNPVSFGKCRFEPDPRYNGFIFDKQSFCEKSLRLRIPNQMLPNVANMVVKGMYFWDSSPISTNSPPHTYLLNPKGEANEYIYAETKKT